MTNNLTHMIFDDSFYLDQRLDRVAINAILVFLNSSWNLGHVVLKIVSVKLLVIVIIDFKRYPSTYCLTHGRCLICINF